MFHAKSRFALLAVAVALAAQTNGKRPIQPEDFDSWKSISSQKLSDDGKFLAYTLTPQVGNAEVILRNLETGIERRENIGTRPTSSTDSSENEPSAEPSPGPPTGRASAPRGSTLSFTADARFLVFSANPSKEAAEKARRDRTPAPKPSLVILPTAGGDPIRIPNVRNFQLAADNPRWLAYQLDSATPPTPSPEAKKEPQDQGRNSSRSSSSRTPTTGADVFLRDLSTQSERRFLEVSEYILTKDGKTIVYAVASKNEDNNGVHAAQTDGSESKSLRSGKGRYSRLTFDEPQQRLAFIAATDLYLWPRTASTAELAVSSTTPGMRSGWRIAERATLSFSKDGQKLFFSTAPAQAARRPAANTPDDKPVADLWHWKDPVVQSMQKVRAEQDRNRSYRAVYLPSEKRAVQLADPSMNDVTPNDDGITGLGADDRDYRNLVEFDERHSDYYTVNLATGDRTLVARKLRGSLNVSPDGKYGISFDGKDWWSLELATARRRNLTGSLGISFRDEEHDSPGTPRPYGSAGWTKDSKSVLLYDRYDIWQLSIDGGTARTITDGVGRRERIQFRHQRFGEERRSPFERSAPIDESKPMLLRAENLADRDTGFWEDSLQPNTPPRKLIMGAKSYAAPEKAKNADVVLFSATRFDEFGDLLLTNGRFENIRKVTNANPQKDQLLWGSAELVSFRNLDGRPLQAALFKPANFDPNRKYPLMVYIYERLSQTLHQFRNPAPGHSINISYYVSNGYVVLTPDIAYTIGYPGQSALKCVLPAIDAIVAKGFIDENAIGIQGHSWGGYQIAHMVTQTTRFKAAAAGAPVANMTSAYNGIRWGSGLPRQFQYERTQSRIGGSLWQYPTRFLENSPLFHADRVQTPLLMLHNDNDDAVPWQQGLEFFLALRRLEKEVYLFNYNGEPHGLRKRPNQKDYTMRLRQFFDHHLKGAPKPAWMERGIPYIEREQEKERPAPRAAAPTGAQ
ncbi:MAG: prolyl oligopeptidase family serine peptidase [Bryobacterales bacterium]|nr:prolyl oligopeptidase family serine peptidase [Bryobacterales bacterium]